MDVHLASTEACALSSIKTPTRRKTMKNLMIPVSAFCLSVALGVPSAQALDVFTITDGSVSLTVGTESWVIPPDGEPKPMWSEKERQLSPTFSPDGRWVASLRLGRVRPARGVRPRLPRG